MAEKTRAQLAAENEELRARVAELESGAVSRGPITRPAPVEPSFKVSEGVAQDIALAQDRIAHSATLTTVKLADPFTGRGITVTEDGWRYDVPSAAEVPDETPVKVPDETPVKVPDETPVKAVDETPVK